MANYSIKIDLMKVKGAFLMNVKGKNCTKKCICIPVDDNDSLYQGEKGVYMGMTAISMKEARYTDTHVVKPDIPKEIREKMTEEQRKAIPILGGLHEIGRRDDGNIPTYDSNTDTVVPGPEGDLPAGDDLPF